MDAYYQPHIIIYHEGGTDTMVRPHRRPHRDTQKLECFVQYFKTNKRARGNYSRIFGDMSRL